MNICLRLKTFNQVQLYFGLSFVYGVCLTFLHAFPASPDEEEDKQHIKAQQNHSDDGHRQDDDEGHIIT